MNLLFMPTFNIRPMTYHGVVQNISLYYYKESCDKKPEKCTRGDRTRYVYTYIYIAS